MARKKTAAPAELEPEEISQEIPEEEPDADDGADDEPETSGKSISKAAAVRDALEQGEESPDDGVAYIRKVHGIEISKQMFSSYKSGQRARDAKKQASAPKGKPGRKPSQAVEGYLAPPPKSEALGDSDLLAALEAIKPLVATLGVDKVKRLADLLG